MSGHETDIQWFIARDGKQHGPVSDVELQKLVELSHLKATDLLWRQGFADWRAATSVFPALAGPGAQPAATAPAPAAAAPSPQSATSSPSAPSAETRAQLQQPAGGSGLGAMTAAAGPKPAPSDPARQSGGGEMRPDQITPARTVGGPAGRPAGPALSAAGPGPGAPHPRADVRSHPGEMAARPHRPAYEAPRARGRKAALVGAGLLAMTATGAWIASQYQNDIFSYVQMDDTDSGEPGTVKADMLTSGEPPRREPGPKQASLETEVTTPGPSQPLAASPEDIDRKLQGRTMWVAVKQEFPEWYQTRVSEVARLATEHKDQSEITRYLVGELVTLRRDNARFALAASTPRHKELAAAFLANLKQLALESGDVCYDFISKGEASATIVSRMDDPAKSAEIEAQMVAVVSAIAEGKKQPAEHAQPIKTDYDVLAGELGRLGWTQADMQLFANPKELAQAPRARVCSMLQDWFTAHLAIQDPSTQARLLFETLKPVISG